MSSYLHSLETMSLSYFCLALEIKYNATVEKLVELKIKRVSSHVSFSSRTWAKWKKKVTIERKLNWEVRKAGQKKKKRVLLLFVDPGANSFQVSTH